MMVWFALFLNVDHLQEIDNSLCLWRFGDYGEKVECGLTEVSPGGDGF